MLSLSRPQVDANMIPTGMTYTVSQVDSALHSATTTWYFRYNLLDSNNKLLRQVSTVTAATVAYNTSQKVKRTAKFTLQDDSSINYLSNRIQPVALLKMMDGYFAKFPLGVFLLSTPPRQTDPALVVTRQIDGYDLNQILIDQKTGDRYTVDAGTNYISAVSTLLQDAGFSTSQMNLQACTQTLPNALDWAGGTAYIDIVNKLLASINYRPLWFDENGVAQAIPLLLPTQRNADYTYQDDQLSVMFPIVTDGIDYFAIPNQWVCVVSEADGTSLVSKYTNSNYNSPTSTTNRGRTLTKYVSGITCPDQATLDTYTSNLAFTDSQVAETITFQTAIMPMHSDYDCLQINFSPLGISAKCAESAWSFDLVQGAAMSHTAQRVVSV